MVCLKVLQVIFQCPHILGSKDKYSHAFRLQCQSAPWSYRDLIVATWLDRQSFLDNMPVFRCLNGVVSMPPLTADDSICDLLHTNYMDIYT